jgi:hypothetical protein
MHPSFVSLFSFLFKVQTAWTLTLQQRTSGIDGLGMSTSIVSIANQTRHDDDNTLYETNICLTLSGEYTFTMYDQAGNGIADPGFYNYTACDGTVKVGGGSANPFAFERSQFLIDLE